MRDAAALAKVAALGPDFLGFIFAPKSPRFVGDVLAPELVRALPPAIWKVGVFVNETTENIFATAHRFSLAAVQLHGQETPAQCEELNEGGLLVMKAFSVGEKVDFDALLPYVPYCDYFLFDTKGAVPGGNGTTFNWNLLQSYNLPVPYFLAGGLGLEHAAELAALRLPCLAGVDLNSCFETAPGVKDAARLAQMLTQLRPGAPSI
ncbi:phosphoribosylanthranilate isomerase [Hymenobacter segetis]